MSASRMTACLFLSGCFLLAFCGCRAKPAPDSGFLQQADLMKPDAKVPYNRMWVNPKYLNKNYTEIYIAPVNTSYVAAQNIWEKATSAEVNPADVKKNIQMLADYTRATYIKAIQNDPKHKYKVVDKVGPNTLILEMAITQAVPSKAELQALGLVPFFFLGAITTGVEMGASTATKSEDQGKGVIAIEARTRDGATGEVNSMFADREHPPTTVLDVKALFWWEPAKPIIDGWARQFVELANNPKKKVNDIPNFELLVF